MESKKSEKEGSNRRRVQTRRGGERKVRGGMRSGVGGGAGRERGRHHWF